MNIVVAAVPLDADLTEYGVECSECGLIGTCTDQQVHDTSVAHLKEHGVDTSVYELPEVPD